MGKFLFRAIFIASFISTVVFDPGSISSTEIPSRALRRHFETGDLVWGQLRGHTSWPGKLVSDGDVKGQTRKEHGKVKGIALK